MRNPNSSKVSRAAVVYLGAAWLCSSAALAAPHDEPPAAAHASLTLDGRASVGKPMAPIAVEYAILGEPEVAQQFQVRITARPGRGISELALEVSADAPLFVSSVSPLAADSGESVWVAVVTPLEDAGGHLNVTVTGILDGEQQARSLLIPIRVGAKSENTGAPSVKTDEAGARIISLPAEESR